MLLIVAETSTYNPGTCLAGALLTTSEASIVQFAEHVDQSREYTRVENSSSIVISFSFHHSHMARGTIGNLASAAQPPNLLYQ